MEDVKIGRASVGVASSVPIPVATPTRVAGPDPNRISITFSCSAIGTVGLMPAKQDLVNARFYVSPGTPTITFNLDNAGSLVMQEWFASADDGADVIGVLEVLLKARKSSDL